MVRPTPTEGSRSIALAAARPKHRQPPEPDPKSAINRRAQANEHRHVALWGTSSPAASRIGVNNPYRFTVPARAILVHLRSSATPLAGAQGPCGGERQRCGFRTPANQPNRALRRPESQAVGAGSCGISRAAAVPACGSRCASRHPRPRGSRRWPAADRDPPMAPASIQCPPPTPE